MRWPIRPSWSIPTPACAATRSSAWSSWRWPTPTSPPTARRIRSRRHKARSLRFDPVWNRTRAVYESKRALFAPGETRYVFTPPRAAHARAASVARRSRPAAATSSSSSRSTARRGCARTIPAAQAGRVGGDHRSRSTPARTRSRSSRTAASAAFWGDPLIVARGAGRPTPNVLFVVIDTLRVDALPAMPRLRALAAEGARFTQAITAATWTRPSVLAMLGGDLPTALGQGAEEMIPSDGDRRRFYAIAPPLLPRVLAAARLSLGGHRQQLLPARLSADRPDPRLRGGRRHPPSGARHAGHQQRRDRVHRGAPRRAVVPAPALRRAALAVHAAAGLPGARCRRCRSPTTRWRAPTSPRRPTPTTTSAACSTRSIG